jgi:hypothetical protein
MGKWNILHSLSVPCTDGNPHLPIANELAGGHLTEVNF